MKTINLGDGVNHILINGNDEKGEPKTFAATVKAFGTTNVELNQRDMFGNKSAVFLSISELKELVKTIEGLND